MNTSPELSRACLKAKQADALRLWYLMRAYNQTQQTPTNRVPRAAFREWCVSLGAYTARRFEMCLRPMRGVWLETAGEWIYPKSLDRLCRHFDVTPRPLTVVIPDDKAADLTTFKAFCYASFFADRETGIISRQSLCHLFGASEPTLKRWEQIAGVVTQNNICQIKAPRKTQADKYPLHLEDKDSYTHWYQCRHCTHRTRFYQKFKKHLEVSHPRRKNRRAWHTHCFIAWRMPNSYHVSLDLANAGRSRVIARNRYQSNLDIQPPLSLVSSQRNTGTVTRYSPSDMRTSKLRNHQPSTHIYTFKQSVADVGMWGYTVGVSRGI